MGVKLSGPRNSRSAGVAMELKRILITTALLAVGPPVWGQVASLDDQAKCSKQAERVFQSQRNDSITYADFTSHYNPKLGMCVVRIKVETSDPKGYIVTVKDAFENVTLGMYANTFPWEDINKDAGGITVDGKYQNRGSLIEFNAFSSEKLWDSQMTGWAGQTGRYLCDNIHDDFRLSPLLPQMLGIRWAELRVCLY
jgi:hypothetical protein